MHLQLLITLEIQFALILVRLDYMLTKSLDHAFLNAPFLHFIIFILI